MTEKAREQLSEEGLPEPRRIYLGSEGCEYLLLNQAALFRRLMPELVRAGYQITLVLPSVEETAFDRVCALVEELTGTGCIDELVVNDLGVLAWVSKQKFALQLRAGHHFDKMLREARFPVEENGDIRSNAELFCTPYLEQTAEKQMLRDLGVVGAETDPVPGFSLCLPADRSYAIWYPRTILSYCTTCEFAGSGLPLEKRFIPGRCKMECLEYQIDVHGDSVQKIVKSGRLVETISPYKLSRLCSGQGRVVWQCQAHDRKANET